METIHTRIWQEEAEHGNAFAALTCHCHGYEIYGDLHGACKLDRVTAP